MVCLPILKKHKLYLFQDRSKNKNKMKLQVEEMYIPVSIYSMFEEALLKTRLYFPHIFQHIKVGGCSLQD